MADQHPRSRQIPKPSQRPSRRFLLGAAFVSLAPTRAFASSADGKLAEVLGPGLLWDPAAGLAVEVTGGTGYATRFGKGVWAHGTRSNVDYAARLLSSADSEASRTRAEQILEKIISLQEIDPKSSWYGAWPWYVEEPLARMSPPDLNWAIFIGNRIAEIIIVSGNALSDGLRRKMLLSLRHACASFVRRSVGPDYTNVFISGARLVTVGGEVLSDIGMITYGRQALRKLFDQTRAQGSFSEYNSPDYTVFDLSEVEAILHFSSNTAIRVIAEALRRLVWTLIADYFHPGTGEWAGPHGRAYSDRLSAELRAQLSARTKPQIKPASPSAPASVLNAWALDCPRELRGRFQKLPWPEQFRRVQFVKGRDESQSIYGGRWMVEEACLGSVSSASLWGQRHPLIGYWRAPTGSAVFRVRCLKDGRDFASFGLSAVQDQGRALVAVHPISGAGDRHLFLDRAKNGVYPGAELRVRFLVDGRGADISKVSEGIYRLACAKWAAVVATGDCVFDGQRSRGRWEVAREGDQVSLDYVVELGGQVAPEHMDVTLVSAAVVIQQVGAEIATDRPAFELLADDWSEVSWRGLSLRAPSRAKALPG
jgi:hypothetical protein